jgi:protein CpxP
MNKLIISIIGAAMLTISGTALAQDESPVERQKKGQHNKRGNQSMPLVSKVMRAVRHLDLSEEQKAGVKAVMHELKVAMRPINNEMNANNLQLKELVTADNYDETAVALVAETEGQLATDRLMLAGRAIADVYAQLTGEQRAELETMTAQRQERRGERRQTRKGEKVSEPVVE